MFSRIDFRGSRIILTGASSGIGRALVPQLGEAGARLVLASRNQAELEAVASAVGQRGDEVHVVPTDVADPAQRDRLFAETARLLGGLDILINNAGVGAMGFFADAGAERLRRIFEVNFFAATELTRSAIPHLKEGRDPMIVNVGSVIGRRGIPGCTEYCASKFALSGWSEGLRSELSHHGIHVLLVSPGVIETDFRAHLLENKARFRWQDHRKMSVERCARLIVKAMRKKKNELVLTLEGKFLLWMNRFLPRLTDYLLTSHSKPMDESPTS